MGDRRDGTDARDVTDWAGGGGSWEPDPPAPTEPPPPPAGKEPKKPVPKKPDQPKITRSGLTTALGASGVVCGRFLPVHRGHQYLIDVARASVEQLLVLVFATPTDPIPGALRVRWLRELYPGVDVELEERTESSLVAPDPGELARAVSRHRARAPHFFFASELAYQAAARALGSAFVPVDPQRGVVPISGTAMRADLMRNFDMLPASVRPWFVRRVAIVGAESTGKSTLCAQLAAAYETLHVPEYARTLAETRGGELDADDLALAARGQIASEDALAAHANRVLFCDTDVRTVGYWAERQCGEAPAWIAAEADARPYDLTIVTSPEMPFVGAAERDQPTARRAFHARLHEAAVRGGGEHILLGTDRSRWLADATAVIDDVLDTTRLLAARATRLGLG